MTLLAAAFSLGTAFGAFACWLSVRGEVRRAYVFRGRAS